MKNKKQYPTKKYIRFLTWLVFAVFTKIFNIKKNMPKEVQELKPPYLVLGNHVGYWDPFIIGHFLPHFTHFVSSDAAFRKPIVRFLLTRLGTIPIKKNVKDTRAIRDIIKVIKQGENVGIFPEGLRNWVGTTFTIDPSIVKLIKLLDIPVVVPVLKGMNLFNPRWSRKLRFTKVQVDYKLLFSKLPARALTDDQVLRTLVEALHHDEVDYQQKMMHKIYSNYRAEHISHALYVCPNCHEIDSFRASKNTFGCAACGYTIYINSYGFFEIQSSDPLFFTNSRDWYNWEEQYMLFFVKTKFDTDDTAFVFKDERLQFYKSTLTGKMKYQGLVDLELFCNRIVVRFLSKEGSLIIDLETLETINPQINDRLELVYNGTDYRFVGERPGVSGLKWEVAVNALWYKRQQLHKLSSYIKQS